MNSKDFETYTQLNLYTVKAYLKIRHGILLDDAEETWLRAYSKAWLESYEDGKAQGEEQAAKLVHSLITHEGVDAVQRAISDKEYRRRKYEEYGIIEQIRKSSAPDYKRLKKEADHLEKKMIEAEQQEQ